MLSHPLVPALPTKYSNRFS